MMRGDTAYSYRHCHGCLYKNGSWSVTTCQADMNIVQMLLVGAIHSESVSGWSFVEWTK